MSRARMIRRANKARTLRSRRWLRRNYRREVADMIGRIIVARVKDGSEWYMRGAHYDRSGHVVKDKP